MSRVGKTRSSVDPASVRFCDPNVSNLVPKNNSQSPAKERRRSPEDLCPMEDSPIGELGRDRKAWDRRRNKF